MPSEFIKALIIEDEANARDALNDILEMVCPEVKVIGSASNVEEGLKSILSLNPDLIFLDIQLGDQQSFEILKKLPDNSSQIIFVTAYNDFAEEAFRFSAADYLLKPINPQRLREAVDKVRQKAKEENAMTMLDVLAENLQATHKNQKKIVLSTLEMMHVVEISNILKCQSSGNYTTFYLTDGKELIISKTLKEFEDQLAKSGFMRVHRSWLINMDYIKGYDRREGGYVLMQDDSQIPVSPLKKEELMKLLR